MSATDGNTEIDYRALWLRDQVQIKQLVMKLTTQTEALGLAAQALVGPVLDLLERDPHSFSTRPCPTCRAISSLTGRPFGCSHMAELGESAFRALVRNRPAPRTTDTLGKWLRHTSDCSQLLAGGPVNPTVECYCTCGLARILESE